VGGGGGGNAPFNPPAVELGEGKAKSLESRRGDLTVADLFGVVGSRGLQIIADDNEGHVDVIGSGTTVVLKCLLCGVLNENALLDTKDDIGRAIREVW
jgi:hypothetical protein